MTGSQNSTFHCLNLPIHAFNMNNTKMLNFKIAHSENDLQGFNSFSEWAVTRNVALIIFLF